MDSKRPYGMFTIELFDKDYNSVFKHNYKYTKKILKALKQGQKMVEDGEKMILNMMLGLSPDTIYEDSFYDERFRNF